MAAFTEQRHDSVKLAITCIAFAIVLLCFYSRGFFIIRRNEESSIRRGNAFLCLTKDCFVRYDGKARNYSRQIQIAKGKYVVGANGDSTAEVNGGIDGLTADDYMRLDVWRSTSGLQSYTRKSGDKTLRKRLPNTLIIGVKKGGTKALLVFLRAHPNIKATNKEVHFFDNEENYRKGMTWYRNQMPESYSHEITLEKSPRYFISGRAPKRVYQMAPDMKLILILRNPVKRAISDYVHMRTRKKHDIITKDIESMLWHNETGKFDSSAPFLQNGLYIVHLRKWLRYFPRQQIHIVNGDELIRNPGGEILKVQAFLGVQAEIAEDDFVFNLKKKFYCIRNRKGFNSHLKKDMICLSDAKGRKHPDVSQKSLHAMREFYRPYNEELYKLVGMDFDW